MYLDHLLELLPYTCLQGEVHIPVSELVYDTRNISCTEGFAFICISGAVSDGHNYTNEAVKNGAVAIIAEKDIFCPPDITVIRVENTRHALALMSAAFFDYPARKLTTIGITGTKGKTTITYMVKSILEKAGKKAGLIGTIESMIGNHVIPSSNTTPESYLIQKIFAQMVEAGCEYVVMEASSQGFKLHRLDGFTFDYGVFTNIEPDHIGENEHKDFEEYLNCKSKLFKQCRHGIINIDDPHAAEILSGHSCTVETYGFSEKADIRAKDVSLLKGPTYLGVAYHVEGQMNFDVELLSPGRFNVYNSLAAITLCNHLGVEITDIKAALRTVSVRGRVEIIPASEHYTVIIDYAHNALSLSSLLSTLKEYNPKRLVCLFGCGGNRSKSRRYEMGEISSNMADFTVVTSDNPRFEEPQDIIDDILTGVKKGPGQYIEIIDRREAVRYCIEHAKEGDVIVLAGKGHEDYQEIKGMKYHMDDREIIQDILAGR